MQYHVETRYRVEYRKVGDLSWTQFAPDAQLGVGTSPTPFTIALSGLIPKTDYEARVIVTKPYGFEQIVDSTPPFTTPAGRPRVDAFSSSAVAATSADLNATINPQGADTTYYFEYGTTPSYGSSTLPTAIGESVNPVTVQRHVDGLASGFVYHFRVVATNDEGTTYSTDQTFNFYPEPCPNQVARQQTGAGSLPDCRAYELVSPGHAGTAVLHPGGPFSAYATSPARFGFEAAVNAIPGPWNAENLLTDRYVATRGTNGWTTQYVGGDADQFGLGGQPLTYTREIYGDLGLSQFIAWKTPFNGGGPFMAPYVKNASGITTGQLPTNAAEVPGATDGATWVGDVQPSGDFSHYFFSSANLAFAPGGVTSGVGSVYDNNVGEGSVSIASKTPGGSDIQAEPQNISNGFLQLAGASDDGTHVLIASPKTGVCGRSLCGEGANACNDPKTQETEQCLLQPGHLYMRVGGVVTYDVSLGHVVQYEGMTDDGSEVFFTSSEQITGDDSDSSIDLYVWRESSDSVTRLSTGSGGVGNTNACAATWIKGCGVAVVPKADPVDAYGNPANNPPSDNSIAGLDGAVYFYSPEQLAGSDGGVPGRRNLFVARHGAVHFVAAIDTENPITRMQVTPSGRFGAFITSSRLTPYDNAGYEMMYRFDDQTGELICASCNLSGKSSTVDVEGSQNGLFLSEPGSAFFATVDALVEDDSNGTVDVYEFTNSKPRLITTGVTGSDEGANPPNPPGLIGVSNNGTDVYFSTLETLVPEDHNGSFLKFYDARTGGGFPAVAEVAPCAAADECHGASSEAVTAPRLGSIAGLGGTGNASQSRCTEVAGHARRLAKQAKTLRRELRRYRSKSPATQRRRAAIARKARRNATRARKLSKRAKRCRQARRHSSTNGRAGK